ncbi:MAG: right-handed parallel beta-helix repeat-containing protein, partial [Gaiellaceae bacterium]
MRQVEAGHGAVLRRCAVLVSFAAAALALAAQANAATFTVNSANDADDELCTIAHCSLREAINNANETPGPDTIGFAILAGPQTITLSGQLPPINEAVLIDGTTQTDFAGTPIIEIDGSNVTVAGANGLTINAAGTTVRGLVINRFPLAGIRVLGPDSVVSGNYLGTDMTGTVDRGNQIGVVVDDPSVIGGWNADDRNVISGNQVGIYLTAPASGVQILGNFIGTNAAGTSALPNTDGIFFDSASDNEIGNVEGGGNVISGNNQFGVRIQNGDRNRVTNNRIGTDESGESELGNVQSGIQISEGDDNSVQRNTIMNNGISLTGIHVQSGVRNLVSENSIDGNGGLGLDLGGGGVTPNDPGDGDAGPNNLQNFPVLTSAVTNGADSIVIDGALDTQAEQDVRIEFFASTGCDSTEHGEGARFLGYTDVWTGGGDVEFTAGFETFAAEGEAITATATIGDNTSEFSKCVDATGTAEPSLVVTSAADSGAGTLRAAITTANGLSGLQTITFAIGSGLQTISPTSA